MKPTSAKTVFLTQESPYPPNGGAKIRDLCIIELLKESGSVDIIDCSKLPPRRSSFFSRLISPFRSYVVNGYNEHVDKALLEHEGKQPVLWVSRLSMAKYIPRAKALGYKIILDEHNVESDLFIKSATSTWRYWPHIPAAIQTRVHEARFCKMADVVVATSDADAVLLNRLVSEAQVKVMPNPIDCVAYESAHNMAGRTILFAGTLSYHPNFEGLRWFAREILPRLKTSLGADLPRIVVAGARPSPALKSELEAVGIEVHADPVSMLPFLKEASIVFVPLLTGSGTRLKILEAMASKKAVVSTTKGAEGLRVVSGVDIELADEPSAFAAALERLVKDTHRREQLAGQGFVLAQSQYDWRQLRPVMQSILAEVR